MRSYLNSKKMLLMFMALSICLTIFDMKVVYGFAEKDNIDSKALSEENERLKNMLASIVPKENKMIYEDKYKEFWNYKPTFNIYPLKEVIASGKDTEFKVLYENSEYLRPIYDSAWADVWFRGWLNMPEKISEARRRIFVFPVGASSHFDFSGSLSWNENVSFDQFKNINLLIYNFNVKRIKLYKNQIALIGEPRRSGAQVISMVQDELLEKRENEKMLSFQLATEGGSEIDYVYNNVIRLDYIKEQIKKHTVRSDNNISKKSIKTLKAQNEKLKKQLSYYIPLDNKVIIYQQKYRENKRIRKPSIIPCSNPSSTKESDLKFRVNYEDENYVRPLYDPQWNKNYKKGWVYIPKKVSEASHKLFVIPKEKIKEKDLLGRLGFHEKYSFIKKDEVGFVVYNFKVDKIKSCNGEIFIYGTPQRTGMNIISVDKGHILERYSNTVHLITQDNYEIDFDILKGADFS